MTLRPGARNWLGNALRIVEEGIVSGLAALYGHRLVWALGPNVLQVPGVV